MALGSTHPPTPFPKIVECAIISKMGGTVGLSNPASKPKGVMKGCQLSNRKTKEYGVNDCKIKVAQCNITVLFSQ